MDDSPTSPNRSPHSPPERVRGGEPPTYQVTAYQDLLLRADYQRQEMSRLADEIKQLRRERDLERFRRLTLEIERAADRKDQTAWAAAVAERLELGAAVWTEVA